MYNYTLGQFDVYAKSAVIRPIARVESNWLRLYSQVSFIVYKVLIPSRNLAGPRRSEGPLYQEFHCTIDFLYALFFNSFDLSADLSKYTLEISNKVRQMVVRLLERTKI